MNRLSKLGINVGAAAILLLSSANQWITNPTALHYCAIALLVLNAVLHGTTDKEAEIASK